jgi:crossover junction endodeoxyribonuclease RusA
MQLSLSYPPTVNNLYKNAGRKGRVKSDAYNSWLQEALLLLRAQRPVPHVGSFRATIVLTRPDRRRRDIDNTVKAILDALKKGGVIEDDSLAQSITVAWAWQEVAPGGSVTVSIEPAEFPIFLIGRAA